MNGISYESINKGDIVRVTQWGGGVLRGRVEFKARDIKNGSPGIDYEVLDARDEVVDRKWAYLDQIVQIVTKASAAA